MQTLYPDFEISIAVLHHISDSNMRIKAFDNIINMLKPNDDDIIVLIDGDDKLNNKYVFEKLNGYYQDNTEITFGNFVRVDKNGKRSNPRVKCWRVNLKKLAETSVFIRV